MILALLLLAQSAPAETPNDVVVTAQKLRRLRLATSVADGKIAECHATVSSGDAGIDRAACEATAACYAAGSNQPEPLADCVEGRVVAYVRQRGQGG